MQELWRTVVRRQAPVCAAVVYSIARQGSGNPQSRYKAAKTEQLPILNDESSSSNVSLRVLQLAQPTKAYQNL